MNGQLRTSRISRRAAFRALYGLYATVRLAAQSSNSSIPVTISHTGLVGGAGKALLVPTAEQQDFFRKREISANPVHGQLEQGQVGVFGSPAVLQGLARGLDLKVIAAFSSGRNSGRLLARPTIRSAEDLHGKVLGANGVGAGAWTMTILALKRLGLDQDGDHITIRFTGLPKIPEVS